MLWKASASSICTLWLSTVFPERMKNFCSGTAPHTIFHRKYQEEADSWASNASGPTFFSVVRCLILILVSDKVNSFSNCECKGIALSVCAAVLFGVCELSCAHGWHFRKTGFMCLKAHLFWFSRVSPWQQEVQPVRCFRGTDWLWSWEKFKRFSCW